MTAIQLEKITHVLVKPSIQLSKVRQRCDAHPDYKVFVGDIPAHM
jgi:hypothetical protein